jgi:hypothetical protein
VIAVNFQQPERTRALIQLTPQQGRPMWRFFLKKWKEITHFAMSTRGEVEKGEIVCHMDTGEKGTGEAKWADKA